MMHVLCNEILNENYACAPIPHCGMWIVQAWEDQICNNALCMMLVWLPEYRKFWEMCPWIWRRDLSRELEFHHVLPDMHCPSVWILGKECP